MYLRGSYNSRKDWQRVFALSSAFLLVNCMGSMSFGICERSLKQDHGKELQQLQYLYVATMLFFCIGAFLSFLLAKALKSMNAVCIISALCVNIIHVLCYFILKNTNPKSAHLIPDQITGTVYFCYILYGASSGLLFSSVLSMVALVIKPFDTGKSFAIFWSSKLAQLLLEMVFNGKLFKSALGDIFGDIKKLVFMCNAVAVVIFCLIPNVMMVDSGDSERIREQYRSIGNFFKSLCNLVKMIPLLGIFDSFEYF